MEYANKTRRLAICARAVLVSTAACVAIGGAMASAATVPSDYELTQADWMLPDGQASSLPLSDDAAGWKPAALRETGTAEAWLHVLGARVMNGSSEPQSTEFHPAPEPSSLVLAAIAAAGLFRLRKRSA